MLVCASEYYICIVFPYFLESFPAFAISVQVVTVNILLKYIVSCSYTHLYVPYSHHSGIYTLLVVKFCKSYLSRIIVYSYVVSPKCINCIIYVLISSLKLLSQILILILAFSILHFRFCDIQSFRRALSFTCGTR